MEIHCEKIITFSLKNKTKIALSCLSALFQQKPTKLDLP